MMRIIHILLCKWRMVAYINGELSPALQRRMARYIEQYPACYAEYRRQRELRFELIEHIPSFGMPSRAHIHRLWHNIERDVRRSSYWSLSVSQWMMYICAVGMLLWTILLITTLHQSDGVSIIITPPTPDRIVHVVETSNPNYVPPTIPPTIVAVATSGHLMIANYHTRDHQTTTYRHPYPTPKIGE